MTRELLILWAGRHDRPVWRDLCATFEKRIARFATIRSQAVRARGGGDRLTAEGSALLQRLPEDSWPVALDVSGTAMDSVAFSGFLARLHREWGGPVVFLLGSDLGLSPGVLERCRSSLSLGPMTYSHELARLMLVEQVYRALAIEKGIKYHREPN